ncbi:hypothetical protein [Aquimarina spinulae]|uniref:hypothetical protein n=1 Tax=Aquimarina spinulae TaxID=1192023 RepID=UPI001048C4B6|nr:hypothetical protein [Aquimarina spinulae]
MHQNNEQLIIDLIKQDLKHCQLVYGLAQLGLEGSNTHHLEILEIIYQLMHIPSEKKNDYLAETYAAFMSMATDYDITPMGESLRPLAKECYHRLKYLIELV